jgi:hypothetical protein
MVVHNCGPSYLVDISRRIAVSQYKASLGKVNERPYLKNKLREKVLGMWLNGRVLD